MPYWLTRVLLWTGVAVLALAAPSHLILFFGIFLFSFLPYTTSLPLLLAVTGLGVALIAAAFVGDWLRARQRKIKFELRALARMQERASKAPRAFYRYLLLHVHDEHLADTRFLAALRLVFSHYAGREVNEKMLNEEIAAWTACPKDQRGRHVASYAGFVSRKDRETLLRLARMSASLDLTFGGGMDLTLDRENEAMYALEITKERGEEILAEVDKTIPALGEKLKVVYHNLSIVPNVKTPAT